MLRPILTEPGTKYFISETLKQCNTKKIHKSIFIYNIALLLLFLLVIVLYLGYKYKTKLTPEEKQKRIQEKQNYILNKIANVFYVQNSEQERMITNLPKFESDYELLHEKFYN
tara:strand:+ start:684 stop:1022 length:339 start_codon:yes stop_codon:yes gene_type:complete